MKSVFSKPGMNTHEVGCFACPGASSCAALPGYSSRYLRAQPIRVQCLTSHPCGSILSAQGSARGDVEEHRAQAYTLRIWGPWPRASKGLLWSSCNRLFSKEGLKFGSKLYSSTNFVISKWVRFSQWWDPGIDIFLTKMTKWLQI